MTYTIEEISIAIEQLQTLREAVLYIIDPQYCDNSDLPVENIDQAMKMVRYAFRGTSYSKEWLEGIIGEDKSKFNNNLKQKTMNPKESYEELEERLSLANIQAKKLFNLLYDIQNDFGNIDEEMSIAHNIKLLTDVTTDEWKYQD
jgi:hypothetical protein